MAIDNWDRLRVFLAVARAGSFNAAADAAGIDQSTISRQILSLEKALGVSLFVRSARGVHATPTGDAIARMADGIEARIRTIEARAAEEMGLSGRIRLWASDGISGYWLPPRLTEFHRRYPGITIEVFSSTGAPPSPERDADVVFTWHEPRDPDTVVLSKGTMTLKPCASDEYLATYGEPRTLADLRDHRLCNHLLYPRTGSWERWAEIVEGHSQVSYVTNSSWALGQATINGIGISLQPVGVEAREPNLRILDLDEYAAKMEFWLSCSAKIRNVPRIRAFIDYIKSEFFQNPGAGSAFMSD